ncbi:MAG: hypothetical protein IPH12_21170 [Saprospirales bacterium]|nr:hypothetical protein [Saprospirales bacterium]MBK8922056.1 hypothetical protein [Saprospirales bacterium]
MENRALSLQTVIVIVAGLLALFLWLGNPWLLRSALAVALAGVFSPWLTAKIHAGWMLLAQGLGWLNGRVLLSVVFFIVLTPIAWLARRFGSSSFLLRKKQKEESYYAERNHTYAPEDLENTW